MTIKLLLQHVWMGMVIQLLDDNQQQQNMGNQPCPQCKQSSAQNPAYGYYQIVSQGGNYYAHIQKQIEQSPKLKQILIQQLQMRCKMENKHLAKLHQFSITDLKYAYTVHFLYELINKSLRDRILQVRQTGLGFLERELFAILYGVEAALQELAKWKVKHCCINLDTILVRNNIYKLTDVSTTTYITSYDLVRKGSREQFLSQRLLNRLFHESLHPIYTYQDDLFSLGLIVLMLGTNSLPTDFYIWDDKGYASLNKKNIQKNFKLLKRRFSSKLVDKVRELLAEGCDGMESICYNGSNEIKIKDFEQDTTIKGCLKRGSRMSTGLSPDKSSSVLHL